MNHYNLTPAATLGVNKMFSNIAVAYLVAFEALIDDVRVFSTPTHEEVLAILEELGFRVLEENEKVYTTEEGDRAPYVFARVEWGRSGFQGHIAYSQELKEINISDGPINP